MIKIDGNRGYPKHRQVYDSIKSQIDEGALLPGALLPSENELAAKFCTSRMTVRNAINALKAEGVLDSMPGVGHRVAKFANATIGIKPLFFIGRRDDITLMLYEGMQERAELDGSACRMISYSNPHEGGEIDFDDDFLSDIPVSDIGGLIFFSDKRPGNNFMSFIRKKRIPMVCVGHQDGADFDCVLVDAGDSARQMAKELIADGHRKAIYATDEYLEKNVESFMTKSRVFCEEFDRSGAFAERLDFLYNRPAYPNPRNKAAMKNLLLKIRKGFTCVAASNPQMAQGIADILSEKGIRIPDDVSLTTFMSDRLRFRHDGLEKHFSGMIGNWKEIGRTATELLISRIRDGRRAARTVLIKSSFYKGDSMRTLPSASSSARQVNIDS